MIRTAQQLREDALAIWRAGVDSLDPLRLLPSVVSVSDRWLCIGDLEFDLQRLGRILVVGGGKAGCTMARGLEAALGNELVSAGRLGGLLSVPGDCLSPAPQAIRLFAGRPAGINEPRAEGAAAATTMLQQVAELAPHDLCICLLSGGGSALLPAPVDGVSLAEKAAVTRLLSGAGATIEQLNAVRKRLSRIKGGGLARSCSADQLVTLIMSDVLGDPLDVIASGPTVGNTQSAQQALDVFTTLGVADHPDAKPAIAAIKQQGAADGRMPLLNEQVVIANNATAVDAAGVEAESRGYSHAMHCATASEGAAERVGQELASMAIRMREESGPDCLITGGEPTVTLVDSSLRGRGGRNQQLALAALAQLDTCRDITLLSGGTDGEDGPTDAAGAWVDAAVVQAARQAQLNPADYLQRNDAYPFFQQAGGLLKTGATGVNACDIRVVTVSRPH